MGSNQVVKSFFRQVLFSCTVFIFLVAFACFNIFNIREAARNQKVSNQIQNSLDDLYESIQQAHLSYFMQQAEATALEESENSIRKHLATLENFESLKSTSPNELAELRELVSQDITELNQHASSRLATNLQKIVGLGDVLNHREENQLATQELFLQNYSWYSIFGMGLAGAVAIGFLLFAAVSMKVSFERLEAAEQKLKIAQAQAENANKMKTQFCAVMSHELRTPLHGILGLTEVLHQQVRQDQRQYTSLIRGAGDSLLKLVNNFLQLTKIENGQISFDIKEFSTREMVERSFHILKGQALARDLDFELKMDSQIPQKIVGDEQKISQILLNLISNAIRYTDHGKVSVLVTVPRPSRLHFEVQDTGIGISADDQKHIFESFYRSENSKSRDGVGIGLSLCASLTHFLRGEIGFVSEPGRGSRFWFEMPVQVVANTAEIFPAEPKASAPLNKEFRVNKLLVVEDNETNQILIQNQLSSMGVKYDLCATGEAALQIQNPNAYDLILLDCQLPAKSGYEVVSHWRKQAPAMLPKIIAMTAHAMPEEKAYCLSVGFDDLLTKPFSRKELVLVLEKYCAHQEEDFLHVNPLADLDDDSFQKLKSSLMTNLENAALKMSQALNDKDHQTIYYWSHTVKPSIKLFEANLLVEICQNIEKKSQMAAVDWSLLSLDIAEFVTHSDSLKRELSL